MVLTALWMRALQKAQGHAVVEEEEGLRVSMRWLVSCVTRAPCSERDGRPSRCALPMRRSGRRGGRRGCVDCPAARWTTRSAWRGRCCGALHGPEVFLFPHPCGCVWLWMIVSVWLPPLSRVVPVPETMTKIDMDGPGQPLSGWLLLRGSSRRWFVLKDSTLCYYHDASASRVTGSIDLRDAKLCYATVPHGNGLEHCFRVLDSKGSNVLLAAEGAEERTQWVSAIRTRIAVPSKTAANRIIFFYGRGGGGHKASANAVKDCLAQDATAGGVECAVTMEDLGTLLEAPVLGETTQRLFTWLGMPGGDDIYNYFMSKGWYRFADLATRMGASTIERQAQAIGDWLCGYLASERPALVVSFIPFVNKVLREALAHALPGVRLLTVITDMEHSDAHRWIDPFDAAAGAHTIVAGGRHLQSQALALGFDGAHLLRTGGMVVHPAYYQMRSDPSNAGCTVRERLDGALPTAVLFFGGFGPPMMEEIAEALLRQFELNLVLLVGKNDALAARLEGRIAAGEPLWSRHPILVDGFIPPPTLIEYISAANCVVGKPGPGVVRLSTTTPMPSDCT